MKCKHSKTCKGYLKDAPTCNNVNEARTFCGIYKRWNK